MKYILKKEYPGSPKLGNIIDNLENDWIENYPEFWEEVVEKDYETLSLIEGKFIYPCDKYSKDYINQLFNTLGVSIYSVKRLSDSEIFTIGDKVVGYNNSIAKIKTIDLVGEISLNIGTDKSESFSLKNLKKVKQPLCTTEDGVDIYLGNKSWILHKNSWYLSPAAIVHNNSNWTPNENEAHWIFSTKEKAEEYILLNKPCLSYNEVLNATKIRNKNTFETLKNLVKSKIQQSV